MSYWWLRLEVPCVLSPAVCTRQWSAIYKADTARGSTVHLADIHLSSRKSLPLSHEFQRVPRGSRENPTVHAVTQQPQFFVSCYSFSSGKEFPAAPFPHSIVFEKKVFFYFLNPKFLQWLRMECVFWRPCWPVSRAVAVLGRDLKPRRWCWTKAVGRRRWSSASPRWLDSSCRPMGSEWADYGRAARSRSPITAKFVGKYELDNTSNFYLTFTFRLIQHTFDAFLTGFIITAQVFV